MAEEKTLFQKIIDGEIPSSKIYEDENALVILDIRPVNKGHLLVIPKMRFDNIYDIPESLIAHLMIVAKKMAKPLKEATRADGINIIMNNEPAAGQQIANHAHIHIVPRYLHDGFQSWHGKEQYKEGEQEEYSNQIKTALGGR